MRWWREVVEGGGASTVSDIEGGEIGVCKREGMAMLIGRSADGSSIHLDDYDRARDGLLQCRACEGGLVAKRGEQRAHHFAHASGRSCDPWRKTSKMGEWHKWWQGFAEPKWREVVVCRREPEWLLKNGEAPRHIADVKNPDSGNVIEVQHSHLSIEEAVEREEFYAKMIWVVDGTGPGVVRMAGKNFAVIEAQREFWGTMISPVYVDTMSGLYLVKEWHEKHKKLCLGMSVELEGFFGSFWGSGEGTSALVTRYTSSRESLPTELWMENYGLEVTGNTYKWRAGLKGCGFAWSAERKCWYFSAQKGREEEVPRQWTRVLWEIHEKAEAEEKKRGRQENKKQSAVYAGKPEWL